MRVTHVSTEDVTGGAARCAHRLHEGLRRLGHDSRMLVRRRRGQDATVDPYVPPQGPVDRAWRRLRRRRMERDLARYGRTRPAWPEPFGDDRSPFRIGRSDALRGRDVVNLHWVDGLVDVGSFFDDLPAHVPVVWTLHDMNLFTGGCHYDAGCGRYVNGCGACPQLGSEKQADLTRSVWARKASTLGSLGHDRLHVVTPSRWLAHEARRSSMLDERIEISVIPYGLDTKAFAPRDRSLARRVLGLPEDACVVLFAAHALDNARKGGADLAEALRSLVDVPGLTLLSVGKGSAAEDVGIPAAQVDFTRDDRLLSIVYSAADLFILPSAQDNLPATVLESIACGTPVVAFEVGGVPDAVRPEETGWLVPAGDVAALSQTIQRALEAEPRRREMAAKCRRVAVEEYGLELQARRYVDLYVRRVHGREDAS